MIKPIRADYALSLEELIKDPQLPTTVNSAVAVLRNGEVAYYCIPPEIYENLLRDNAETLIDFDALDLVALIALGEEELIECAQRVWKLDPSKYAEWYAAIHRDFTTLKMHTAGRNKYDQLYGSDHPLTKSYTSLIDLATGLLKVTIRSANYAHLIPTEKSKRK